MITVQNLTKAYKGHVAVDGLSFEIPNGQVTGFLGPNGAGKSTTMRMIVGLERPTQGEALINGKPFRDLAQPAREVGALLNPGWIQSSQSGRSHLKMMAKYAGVSDKTVDDALAAVGLTKAANRKVKGYSLGMRQRLGLATALIGNPQHVFLDEPVNGLDPNGVAWMRQRMRDLAAEGKAVFVSSHLMTEMQLTADRLVVIKNGKLLGEGALDDFLGESFVEIICDNPDLIARELEGVRHDNTVRITGKSLEDIGQRARELGITVYGLSEQHASLEDAFLNAMKENN